MSRPWKLVLTTGSRILRGLEQAARRRSRRGARPRRSGARCPGRSGRRRGPPGSRSAGAPSRRRDRRRPRGRPTGRYGSAHHSSSAPSRIANLSDLVADVDDPRVGRDPEDHPVQDRRRRVARPEVREQRDEGSGHRRMVAGSRGRGALTRRRAPQVARCHQDLGKAPATATGARRTRTIRERGATAGERTPDVAPVSRDPGRRRGGQAKAPASTGASVPAGT